MTFWTIDLNMEATHPGAKLHEFYVNLVGDSSDYVFSGFTPDNWEVTDTDGNNANGSGNV